MTQPARRFAPPTRAFRVPETRAEIIEPVLGFDRSQPAQDLQPGMTPDSDNFIVLDGFLTPRSGLSQLGSGTSLSDVGLLAIEHQDIDGNRYPVVASAGTVSAFLSNSWSTLSYIPLGPADPLSGLSTDLMYGTSIYDADRNENVFVFCNGLDLPKLWEPSQTTYTEVSDFTHVGDAARIPYGLDNRLCFFHTIESAVSYPTRVRWSARGVTSNFSGAAAGFQDLIDMRGIGNAAVVRQYDAILFSSEEVWQQRPRRDIFAFDFVRLEGSIGCPYPKTIVNTPQGVVFLTRELEPYIVRGNQIQPIGAPVHRYLRDNMRNPEYSFGVYNAKLQRYELYFDAGGSARPSRGLYLDMDRPAWMPINMHDHELSAGGAVGADVGGGIIWDKVTQTWDELAATWNAMVESTSLDKDVMVVSSAGTVYRFRDEQMTDNGSTITAHWASHAMLGEDATRYDMLYEFRTDYQADSPGAFTLDVRGSPDENFVTSSVQTYIAASNTRRDFTTPAVTGISPQFRVTVSDGKRPRFARFTANLRDVGQY